MVAGGNLVDNHTNCSLFFLKKTIQNTATFASHVPTEGKERSGHSRQLLMARSEAEAGDLLTRAEAETGNLLTRSGVEAGSLMAEVETQETINTVNVI